MISLLLVCQRSPGTHLRYSWDLSNMASDKRDSRDNNAHGILFFNPLQKKGKTLREKRKYIRLRVFESLKVNGLPIFPRAFPFGCAIRRECVLQTSHGGMRMRCQQRAVTLNSKPQPSLLLLSFPLFLFVKTDFLSNTFENTQRMVFT